MQGRLQPAPTGRLTLLPEIEAGKAAIAVARQEPSVSQRRQPMDTQKEQYPLNERTDFTVY